MSIATEHRLRPTMPQGAVPDFATQVLMNLRGRHTRMAASHPAALELLRDALVAGHDLLGSFKASSGAHSTSHWNDMWRGVRTLPAADLSRLSMSPSPDEREAAMVFARRIQIGAGGVNLKAEFAAFVSILERVQRDPVFMERK
jgi:hypothetical protein